MKKLLASSMGSNEKVNSNKLFCTLKISKDLIEYVQKKIKFFCPILDTSTCMQAYILFQYGESWNESESTPIFNGTF